MPQDTPTKLTLARWGQLMGLHPLHLMQVRMPGYTDGYCSDIYFTESWQTADHVSRNEISRAIKEAEDNIESQLGYHIAPTWEVDEWRETMRPFRQEFVKFNGADIRGYRDAVRANWGYFISGGIQGKTRIQANAPIVWSDADGDGYSETGTVIVATVALDRNEIALYYPGHDGEDEWEIRPIEVSIAVGSATITFRRELAVREDKLYTMDIQGAEAIGTDDGDFLADVDVYRRYNDPQSQAAFLWEPLAFSCGSCSGEGCPSCAYAIQTGCLLIRGDPRQSLVSYAPADWDSRLLTFNPSSWVMGRSPDIVRLYYLSGWRDKTSKYTSRLDRKWERTVAYYAAALLDRPPCDCSADRWRYWREDLTLSRGDEDGQAFYSPAAKGSILDNPFGPRRGMVNAWRALSSNDTTEPIGRAVAL